MDTYLLQSQLANRIQTGNYIIDFVIMTIALSFLGGILAKIKYLWNTDGTLLFCWRSIFCESSFTMSAHIKYPSGYGGRCLTIASTEFKAVLHHININQISKKISQEFLASICHYDEDTDKESISNSFAILPTSEKYFKINN